MKGRLRWIVGAAAGLLLLLGGSGLAFDTLAMRELGPILDSAVADRDLPLHGWKVVSRSPGLNAASVVIELEHSSLVGALIGAFLADSVPATRAITDVTVDLRRRGLSFEPIRATSDNPVVAAAVNLHLDAARARERR